MTLENAKIDVETGNLLRIHCSVTSDSKIAISWDKDGKPLQKGRVLGEDVYVADASKNDEGNYTCTVSNSAGAASASQFVHVLGNDIFLLVL